MDGLTFNDKIWGGLQFYICMMKKSQIQYKVSKLYKILVKISKQSCFSFHTLSLTAHWPFCRWPGQPGRLGGDQSSVPDRTHSRCWLGSSAFLNWTPLGWTKTRQKDKYYCKLKQQQYNIRDILWMLLQHMVLGTCQSCIRMPTQTKEVPQKI